jgi:membrane protein required for colicin V production
VTTLNVTDWVIIVVIGVSTLISLWRGFVKEAFSLASWILALVLALVFSDRLAYLLSAWVANPWGRYVLAFAILFVGTMVVGALLAHLTRGALAAVGLGGLDRALGTVFGAARGVLLLLAAAVILRPGLGLDQYAWWRESQLLPHLLLLEGWFRGSAESIRDVLVKVN